MRAPSPTSFPAAVRLGLEPRTDGRRRRVGLDPPRRRQPGARRAGRAAGRGRGRPRGRRARPQAARVALAAPAARGRRDDLRHRPPGDGPGAQRVRPGPARRRPHACSPSTPPACWSAARCSRTSAASTSSSPVFGNDIDFGWRAAAAGHKTIVVPAAVVFHAEAAHRGVRRTPLTGRHTHYQERRAALYTLLANARGRCAAVAGRAPRARDAAAGARVPAGPRGRSGPRRARRPGLALRQPRPARGRPARAEAADRPPTTHDVRGLLAPWWLPYRHGLDAVSDLVDGPDPPGPGRRRAPARGGRRGRADHPVTPRARARRADDDEAPEADTGLVARFLTSPVALGVALFVLLVLFGAREAIGPVSGGGLSAAPAGARDLWRLHTESWHALGQGTAVPAPPYVLPLAMLASVIGGSVSPRCRRSCCWPCRWRCGGPGGSCGWSATSATRRGRAALAARGGLGHLRAGPRRQRGVGRRPARDRRRHRALLPWLGHAALGFADPEPDRRWRAAWRSGLLLALVAAFTPVAWFFAAVLGVALVGVGFAIAPAPDARPLGVGTPGRDARVRAGAALAVVAAGGRPRRRSQPAARLRPAARPRPRLRRAPQRTAPRRPRGAHVARRRTVGDGRARPDPLPHPDPRPGGVDRGARRGGHRGRPGRHPPRPPDRRGPPGARLLPRGDPRCLRGRRVHRHPRPGDPRPPHRHPPAPPRARCR